MKPYEYRQALDMMNSSVNEYLKDFKSKFTSLLDRTPFEIVVDIFGEIADPNRIFEYYTIEEAITRFNSYVKSYIEKLENRTLSLEEISGYLGSVLADDVEIYESARKAAEVVCKSTSKNKMPSHDEIVELASYVDKLNFSNCSREGIIDDYIIAAEALSVIVNEQ